MRPLIHVAVFARKVTAAVCVAIAFWGIGYRMFIGLTPVWLDLATAILVPSALLVLLALGQTASQA